MRKKAFRKQVVFAEARNNCWKNLMENCFFCEKYIHYGFWFLLLHLKRKKLIFFVCAGLFNQCEMIY